MCMYKRKYANCLYEYKEKFTFGRIWCKCVISTKYTFLFTIIESIYQQVIYLLNWHKMLSLFSNAFMKEEKARESFMTSQKFHRQTNKRMQNGGKGRKEELNGGLGKSQGDSEK